MESRIRSFLSIFMFLQAVIFIAPVSGSPVPFDDDISFLVPVARGVNANALVGEGERSARRMGGQINLIKEPEEFTKSLFLRTGKADQALIYSADKNFPDGDWTISFEVIGQDWDAGGPGRDMFFRIEGKDASLELFRDTSAELQLSLIMGGSQIYRVAGSMEDIDMSIWRFVTVACNEGAASIYIDKDKIAEGVFSTAGIEFEDIIFGQAGPGESENRLMRNLIIYRRALEHPEVARAFYFHSRVAPERFAAINRTSRQITIDGVIDPEEWRDATVVTGLIDSTRMAAYETYRAMTRLPAQYQSRFYITYDDEYLYVAMDSPTPDFVIADPHGTAMGSLLQNTVVSFDASVDRDDHFEVRVVVPHRNGDTYRFISNGLNTRYDFTTGGSHPDSVLEGIDLGWDPEWIVENVVDLEGGWQVEARLPLSSISAPRPVAGTEWGMNFIRGWRHLINENNAWTFGVRLEPDREFLSGAYALGVTGLVRFQDAGPAVQLFETGNVSVGELALKGKVVNTSGVPYRVVLEVTSDSGEIEHSEVLELGAGGKQDFDIDYQIKGLLTNFVTFSARTDTRELYTMTMPVFLSTEVKVTSRSYPTAGEYILDADLSGLAGIPAGELSVESSIFRSVRGRARGRAVLRNNIAALRSHNVELPFDVDGIPEGEYIVRLTVRHGREVLVEEELKYEKLPMPEWYGNTIGISDKVPPPFEPMSVDIDADTINVWGRQYRFANGLFPEQITILGKSPLRSPVEVRLTADSGEVFSSSGMDASVEWVKVSDTRIECIRTLSMGDYSVKNTFWMEYDGFMWSNLEVTSTLQKDIHGLELLIPFTAEFTDVINPHDYSQRDTGILGPDGWNGGQRPVWVGNAIGGIQWLAESDADWNVSDTDRQVVVENNNGVATTRVTFVDLPTHLRTPLPIPFGLVATPVKPAPRIDPNHNPTIGWSYRAFPAGKFYLPGADGWYDAQFITDGVSRGYLRAKHMSNTEPRRTYTGPYVCTARVIAGTPEFEQFADEWFASERSRKGESANPTVSQASASYRDYFVWRYWKLFQKNPFASLYYDVSSSSTGLNRYAGQGYQRRDGSWASSEAILGNRDIAKRLYTMIKLEYPDAMIKYHNSGMVNMAFLSFTDFYVTGENTISMLTKGARDYRGKIRPDDYRADMMGHNFGFRGEFLYQFTRSGLWSYESMREEGPYMVDHIMGLSLLHDAGYWASYGPWEFALRMERALERHGWRSRHAFMPNYDFVPYWEQDIVEMPGGSYATFYMSGQLDKVFAVFYNDTEAAGEQRIRLDWEKLGFNDLSRLRFENTGHEIVSITKESPLWYGMEYDFMPNPDYYVRLEGDELVVSLHPYDYQLVVMWIE